MLVRLGDKGSLWIFFIRHRFLEEFFFRRQSRAANGCLINQFLCQFSQRILGGRSENILDPDTRTVGPASICSVADTVQLSVLDIFLFFITLLDDSR